MDLVGLGLHIRDGIVVTVDTLRIDGGAESIRSETDAILFGRQIFTYTSPLSIHFLGHTGLGRTSVQDSQFFSAGTTIVADDDTANVTFTRCVLQEASGGTSMQFAGGFLTDVVFDQCEVVSNALGIENLSGTRISFIDCRMTSQSGVNATLSASLSSSDFSIRGGKITNTGPGFVAFIPVTISDLEVESTGGSSAALFSGPGGSEVTNSVFKSSAVSGGVVFDSPNNVFSNSRAQGVVQYTTNAVGNTVASISADATTLGVPAILVEGQANTFTALRTRTALAVAGVSLSASSQNNIVAVLSAFGPGLGGLAVSDTGAGNEVAHVIST